MPELKPCPFCGAIEYLEMMDSDAGVWSTYWVRCKQCACKKHDTEEQAIAAWNKRAEQCK